MSRMYHNHLKQRNVREEEEHVKMMVTRSSEPVENEEIELQERSETSQTKKVSADIKVKTFTLRAEGKDLFVNAKLLIANGGRYGLIGPNGCGKTALLRHIATKPFPCDIEVLHWKQEVFCDGTLSAYDTVLKANVRYSELETEWKKLKAECEKLSDQVQIEKIKERLKVINDVECEAIDVDSLRSRAYRILKGLGMDLDMQEEPMKNFSESWKIKISLARALFVEPCLLLLEDPTKDLDSDAVIWLENYLQEWKNTLIVVSHDRCFLDNVCNQIIHVDQQKLFYYKGNYSLFKKQFEENKKKELKKLELKAQKESKKGAEKDKTTEKDKALLEIPKDCTVRFSFPDPGSAHRMIVSVMDITFGYEGQEPIFVRTHLDVNEKFRGAILGGEGTGKSTFLKLIGGQETPQKGEVVIHPCMKIARFDQYSGECLPDEETPSEYLVRSADNEQLSSEEAKQQLSPEKIKEHLSTFGLANLADSIKIKHLSCKEKARLALAKLSLNVFDAIIMDEPTKYLDIEMIDALADAINRYNGAVFMISNDEYLIRETDCDLWVVMNRDLDMFEGQFDDYRKHVLTELGEPINNLFNYKRKATISRRDYHLSPVLLRSTSKIIDECIEKGKTDASVREIGKYKILYGRTSTGYSCYCPTLPGVVGSDRTKELCEKRMRKAIEFHIESMLLDGDKVPTPDEYTYF